MVDFDTEAPRHKEVGGDPRAPREGWRTVKLGDAIAAIGDHRGRTPPKLSTGKYRVLSAKNIKTGRIVAEDSIGYFDDELYKKYVRLDLCKGDIIITSEAPFGEVYYWNSDEKAALSQRLFSVRANADVCGRYLYYYMTSEPFQAELASRASGTTVMGLRQPELLKCEISLPPLATQRKIAGVLGALDDKIELNRKMNANLEAQAQALFKSWFVDFDPWGGKRPSGWREGTLGEIVEVCYGKDHKKLADGVTPVYGSGGLMRYVDRPLYDKESVLIPRKGTLNNIMYSCEPFWTVDTMFYTKMRLPNVAKFVFLFMKGKDMSAMNTGSAVPSMTTDILNGLPVLMPEQKTLNDFEKTVAPLFRKHRLTARESRKLAEMRDALLPKLMSGELEVA